MNNLRYLSVFSNPPLINLFTAEILVGTFSLKVIIIGTKVYLDQEVCSVMSKYFNASVLKTGLDVKFYDSVSIFIIQNGSGVLKDYSADQCYYIYFHLTKFVQLNMYDESYVESYVQSCSRIVL
jgi:hypothetical protein